MTLNCIVTDLHGKSPLDLLNIKVDRYIFLGDYQNPNVLGEILDNFPDAIVLPGNYEHSHVRGHKILGPRDRFPDYWERYPREKAFVERQIKNNELTFIDETEIGTNIYLHGSLAKNGYDTPEVWGTVNDLWDAEKEFKVMKERDLKIMFRGHNHRPSIFKWSSNPHYISPTIMQKICLNKDYRYIVTVGAFEYNTGSFILFDDDKLTVEFTGLTVYNRR